MKVTFRCPVAVVKAIEEEAVADHRDRTSMLNKIVSFYFENNPRPNGEKPSNKKKAGFR